ncbi:hypothetical protein PHJA_002440800 [Phtheirospermum japonicum]|uniref:RING-CH-type domain-containing protein n=1 Tax=Phtheirospermum japonicum TaxID=374723 RepID=A0A830CVC8_9LAMI|nr:hypothetical protein PHJA_002440800 [Phtheirospermum japonicum]
MPHTDIESGRRSSAENGGSTGDDDDEEEDGSPIFSDADPCDCSVDVESGENKVDSEKVERECRICQLSLFSSSPGPASSSGVAIDLGCSCKDDLAAAHKHCAETWFKIKGNKVCEICNSIAQNVIGPSDIESGQQAGRSGAAARRCLNGHRFLNFMLACMVFAFVISWLFHFNIPS